MVKFILILLVTYIALNAKSNVDACIPIGKIVILKKSIMTLDLNDTQKKTLLKYEEKLRKSLLSIKDNANNNNEKLSDLFDENKFLKNKFTDITIKENISVTKSISEYFENMYKILTKKQKAKLIKRFKRIERKRTRKITQ